MKTDLVILTAFIAFIISVAYVQRRLLQSIILLYEIALLPAVILFHLLVSPYTKVEESFNLQATHDILEYGTPTQNIAAKLRARYDHFEFPGAVPRTFVGATVLAGLSRPIIAYLGSANAQLVVRGVLGCLNAAALLRYKIGVDKAFGKTTGRWYLFLLASQFHVIYYASRTLPNMFAFGLSTLAMRELLPIPTPSSRPKSSLIRYRRAIYLFVLAGVIFRAELAILLATNLVFLLWRPAMSLQEMVPTGLMSTAIALTISIPIDSYFWQRPIWPELAGFVYNAIQGKSSDWGTSPIHAYFTSFLPKLLLNPFISFLLIPLALYLPSTHRSALALAIPSLAFVAIYSLQAHKEARFIIYVVPPLTTTAALSASYIWRHRSRSIIYRLLSLLLPLSILATFALSTLMLLISSLNYPGGEALYQLHRFANARSLHSTFSTPQHISVHMDVLSCMTGVSRFQQAFSNEPFYFKLLELFPANITSYPNLETIPTTTRYSWSKSESPMDLESPAFWSQFDYVLTANPELVLGKWETVETVYGYSGIEFLRPGEGYSGIFETMMGIKREDKDKILAQEFKKVGLIGLVKELMRYRFTKGWWVGPRMEKKIWILLSKSYG